MKFEDLFHELCVDFNHSPQIKHIFRENIYKRHTNMNRIPTLQSIKAHKLRNHE